MAETGKGLDLVRIRMAPDRTLKTQEPVSTPIEAVDLITRELGDLDREVFMVLNLTCHLQVINMNICSMGTLTYSNQIFLHPGFCSKSASD